MKTQVKPPDNERNWKSIDIFLFTNGQQYSPPRKHHLRVDDLHWWDATLCSLAKSQFGCMHSAIQLYTLDGHQVDGPLELRNGMAYVAVEPPDLFIDSGYNKYIIKASRSWEKRHAKQASVEITPDGVIIGENIKTDTNASELISIKPLDENFTVESIIGKQNISATHPEPALTSKQIDKKRTFNSQRIAAFKKVTNSPITAPPIKKMSLKTKEQSPKKFYKSNTTRVVQGNLAKSKMHTKPQIIPKEIEHKQHKIEDNKENKCDSLTKITLNYKNLTDSIPVENVTGDKENKRDSLTKITLNYKNLTTDSIPVENVTGDKEIIPVSNIYQNPESEIKSVKLDNTTKREQTGIQYSSGMTPNYDEKQSVDLTSESTEVKKSMHRDGQINNTIKMKKPTLDQNIIHSNSDIEDNYVAFINKGDYINLRLMIEVRNFDKPNAKYRTIRNRLIKNNVNTEKESQSLEDEVIIQRTSLQSVLETEYSKNENADGDPKILLVRCECGEYDIENSMSQVNVSVDTSNKKYLVLLPNWNEHSDKYASKYDESVKMTQKLNTQKEEQSSKCSYTIPIKKTYSDISIERIDQKTANRGNLSRDRQVPLEVNHCIYSQDNIMNTEYEKPKMDVVNDCISNPDANSNLRPSQVSQRTEYIVRRQTSIKDLRVFIDRSTQTEISDILLEARRREDGRYTFHLPSLHTLKCYKL